MTVTHGPSSGVTAHRLPDGGVGAALLQRLEELGDAPLLHTPDRAGVSGRELADLVRTLAAGLRTRLAPGDRVLLLGTSAVEWVACDLAAQVVGVVTVPVYPSASAAQIAHLVSDSGAVLTVVTGGTRPPVDDLAVLTVAQLRSDVAGSRFSGMAPFAPTPGTPATLVYTSGTTGAPKGCILTHGNLWAAITALQTVAPDALGLDRRALLGLPLAHAYPRVLALSLLRSGTPTWLTDPAGIVPALPVARPTFLAAVPRLLESLMAAATARAHTGEGTSAPDPAAVGQVLRALLAGHCEVVLTAGAPLRSDVGRALTAAGATVLDAWGMTETTTLGAMTRAGTWEPGTIGPASPGTALRIAPDGELQVSGPGTFAGYWKDPDATAQAFTDDGWLRTGDLADLDAQGRLSLRGRNKDVLVTSGGKNVAPGPLEEALTATAAVEQAVVLGDGRPFVTALVTLTSSAGFREGLPAVVDLGRDGHQVGVRSGRLPDEVAASVAAAVREVNQRVSRAESIRRVAVLPGAFDAARGELTPTMKLRRAAILDGHRDVVDALYAEYAGGRP